MSLDIYRHKRDFRRTDEPSGTRPRTSRGQARFVIQHHVASSDHYDFRLEADGVLKSWAVPKGPSTDPRRRRLAVPTEDHPLDYAEFEGTIPEGEYGAGRVLVWDAGTYRNLTRDDDGEEVPVGEALAGGRCSVWLKGHKLRGGYTLIRTGGERWLLVKNRDEGADARRRPTSTQPESVLTGRTLLEIGEEASGDG